jgi:hypothetical protein
MTITTTFVIVLRRFKYLAEKVMYSNHYSRNKRKSDMTLVVNVCCSLYCNYRYRSIVKELEGELHAGLAVSSKFHVFGLIVKFCIIYRQYFMCLS